MIGGKFEDELKLFCEKINSIKENEIHILVSANPDGICAGSILADSLTKNNAKVSFRVIANDTYEISGARRDDCFYIFIDFPSESMLKFQKTFDNGIFINHDLISENQLDQINEDFLNPSKYGINGNKEISSSGISYLLSTKLNGKNSNLINLAIVGALSKKQDIGQNRSFVGINSEIISVAQENGLLKIDTGLMITCKNSAPLPEAMASTLTPFIYGITGDKENCQKIFRNVAFDNLKNKWRVYLNFSEDEKAIVLDSLSKFIAISSKNVQENIDKYLIGNSYIFPHEDIDSIVYDAREFVLTLEACIRYKKFGVGFAICLGERNRLFLEAEKMNYDLKKELINYISKIFNEKWRIFEDDACIFVNAEGILREDMIESVSLILSQTITFNNKLLVIRTVTKDGNCKITCIKCVGYRYEYNLVDLVKEDLLEIGGYLISEIQSNYVSCIIPYHRIDNFLSKLKDGIIFCVSNRN